MCSGISTSNGQSQLQWSKKKARAHRSDGFFALKDKSWQWCFQVKFCIGTKRERETRRSWSVQKKKKKNESQPSKNEKRKEFSRNSKSQSFSFIFGLSVRLFVCFFEMIDKQDTIAWMRTMRTFVVGDCQKPTCLDVCVSAGLGVCARVCVSKERWSSGCVKPVISFLFCLFVS